MKNLDLFSRRFLIISISISMIFLSASLFIISVNTANAQKNNENEVGKTIKNNDCYCPKYQFFPFVENSKDGGQFTCLYIFNTETGTLNYVPNNGNGIYNFKEQ
jgi:hypothetical protein